MKPAKYLFFDQKTTFELLAKIKEIIMELYHDYFSEIDEDEFQKKYVFHTSLVMKCAAYRFANQDLWVKLKKQALKILNSQEEFNGKLSLDDFFCHPIFYLRYSSKNVRRHNEWDNVFLDSQPHYDRSFNIKSFTFWLTFLKADINSGGLCFFNETNKLNNEFKVKWGEKNKHNYDTYVKKYLEIDEELKKNCIHPNLNAGECYLFDSNVLHGATKPKNSDRISFDFRFVLKKDLENAENRNKKIFEDFNNDINLSNSKNLKILGDYVGSKNHGKPFKLNSKYIINSKDQKFSWQDEYSWIN